MSTYDTFNARALLTDMKVCWRHMGKNARERFIEELQSVPLPTKNIDTANCKHAIDYSDKGDWFGMACVYAWVTEDWEIIYIGCGCPGRAIMPSGRNEKFEHARKTQKLEPYIICNNVDKNVAEQIETLCIWKAQLSGWQITNIAKTLSDDEIQAIEDKDEESSFFADYKSLSENYNDALSAFEEFSDACHRKNKSGKPESGRFLTGKLQEGEIKTSRVWLIDGDIKSAREWCEIYGKSLGSVIERTERYGCTIKEALTFPPVPKEYRCKKNAPEYWKELGLVPGTENGSRELAIAEWPAQYIPYGSARKHYVAV